MAGSLNTGAYGAMLRVKEAYPFEIGGFLMRMYGFMRTVGTITMLTLAGCSYFMAGLVASAVALALFIISPRVSRLVDERGQGKIVLPAMLVAMSGCLIMIITVLAGWPVWVCFIGAVLMGFLPTPQALTRARWVYLVRSGRLGDDAPDLKTVFSYEGVIDDVVFMISPALSIALAASIHPVAGQSLGLACGILGTLLIVASKSTEPEPGWENALQEGGTGGSGAKLRSEAPSGSGSPEALRGPGSLEGEAPARKGLFASNVVVRIVFFLSLLMGAFYGVFDTATVSFAQINLGNPSFASLVLVVESLISTVAGLVFGMIIVSGRQSKKMLVASIAIGVCYGFMAFVSSAATLMVITCVSAATYAPFIITMNETVEQAVPASRLTEALTWVTSGSTCGLAVGPTLAGIIIDGFGSIACYGVGALVALAIPVLAVLTYPLMKKQVG